MTKPTCTPTVTSKRHDGRDGGWAGWVKARACPAIPTTTGGWSFTGWYDTTESQALLDFQEHPPWSETVAWVAGSQSGVLKTALGGVAGPLIRPVMRLALAAQRRQEGRGRYADPPWNFIASKYGPEILAGAGKEPT